MMANIELEKAPSKYTLLLRAAATANKPGKLQGEKLPVITASLKKVKADLKKLKEYNRVCGFPVSGSMPVTYPHILAFPLHMEMMIDPSFPFPMLGMVHVKNEITQYRAIGNQEELDIHCELLGPEVVAKGLEFTLYSKVSTANKVVWEGRSTYLTRTKTNVEDKKADKKEDTFSPEHLDYWEASEGLGRQYAKVSGDSNPIHLHAMTAKMFGFPRAIAHGMWNKAHAIAKLNDYLPHGPFKVSVAFKLPVLLPNKVQFQYAATGDTVEFRVKDKNGEKPHMSGTIQAL